MKNKIILLLSIVISSISYSYGQPRGLKFSNQKSTLDIVVGGDFGFRQIKGNSSHVESNQIVQNREGFENQKLNYRFGFNYYHGISERILIKTGLRIANPGFGFSNVDKIDPKTDINLIEKSYQQNGLEYRYNYQILEVPLGIKYVITGSTCKPYVELAVSANFYGNTIVKEISYEGKVIDKVKISENINPINYIANFSAGGEFIITDKIAGFSQLVARYQINNLRIGEIEEKLFGLGLEMGIRYQIN
jgi:hypothetical protein